MSEWSRKLNALLVHGISKIAEPAGLPLPSGRSGYSHRWPILRWGSDTTESRSRSRTGALQGALAPPASPPCLPEPELPAHPMHRLPYPLAYLATFFASLLMALQEPQLCKAALQHERAETLSSSGAITRQSRWQRNVVHKQERP